MKTVLSFSLMFLSIISFGQKIIASGEVYNPGEEIYTPTLGFKAVVPQGWMGMLPQNSTIFLLSSLKGLDGSIYLLGDTTNFEMMKAGWAQGLELGEGRVLKSDGKFEMKGDLLTSGVILTGTDQNINKGFIAARCGEYGRCVSALLICEGKYLEDMKKSVDDFLESVTFVNPIIKNEYDGFDWKQFLGNKKFMHYGNVVGTKSVNEVWLCEDGSFMSKLKRTGIVKGDIGKYKGKHKGTWSTSSFGKTGTLTLNFDKLPPVEVELLIDEEQIFMNGKRHVALAAAMCK